MNLSEILNHSAEYTGTIFKRIGEFIILLILSIIPIVDFIALGYYANIVRDSPSSKDTPKLERYGDLFVEGLKIFVVGIIWFIIFLIIAIIVAIPLFAFAAFSTFTSPASLLTGGFLFALGGVAVVFAVVAFFLGLIAFMGIIHMVKTKSFGKAFAFGEILNIIGKIGWLRYLAFFVIFFVVGAVVAAITGALGPIGWVVSAVLSVLVGLFFSRTIGLLYDDAAGANMAPPPQAPPTPMPQPQS